LPLSISIIGGGASALMLAATLDPQKFDITIYDANKALGRKFLVAGDGGLNLTHSESPDRFIMRYTPSNFISKAFYSFTNIDLINWLSLRGIQTFVGTSKRVFPKKELKPIDVLNVFLETIKQNKIKIKYQHSLKAFNGKGGLVFEHFNEKIKIKSNFVIFCLGGASWSVTGSKGDWLKMFASNNIQTSVFEASNCAYKVNWDENFIKHHHGKILKNIQLTCQQQSCYGEIVLTKFGIEGSGIYPLSPQIRKQLKENKLALISIDLKPTLSEAQIEEKLCGILKNYNGEQIKKCLNLSSTQIALLKNNTSKTDFLNHKVLPKLIKNLKIELTGLASIEEAISTVGGIELNEINEHFELIKIKNHFVLGEMLNYDAPTGGYLLQSCFSMANYLARHLNEFDSKLASKI
jgi:uncharacterized flavoprotein (TIGR03862 family)